MSNLPTNKLTLTSKEMIADGYLKEDATTFPSIIIVDGWRYDHLDFRNGTAQYELNAHYELAEAKDRIAALDAEIERLREGYVLLEAVDALFEAMDYYSQDDCHEEYAKLYVIKDEMKEWGAYKQRFNSTDATDVTPDEDMPVDPLADFFANAPKSPKEES